MYTCRIKNNLAGSHIYVYIYVREACKKKQKRSSCFHVIYEKQIGGRGEGLQKNGPPFPSR
jgi:hypothetical protein